MSYYPMTEYPHGYLSARYSLGNISGWRGRVSVVSTLKSLFARPYETVSPPRAAALAVGLPVVAGGGGPGRIA
jgi:hypothetical protein